MKHIKTIQELNEGVASVGPSLKTGFNFASLSRGAWITDGKIKVRVESVGADDLVGKRSDNNQTIVIKSLKGWSPVNEAKRIPAAKLSGEFGSGKNKILSRDPLGSAHEPLPKSRDRKRNRLIEDVLFIMNDTLKPGADKGSTQAVIDTKDLRKAAARIADFVAKMEK